MQRVIRDHCEQLYAKIWTTENKLKFLGTHNLPRLNHDEKESLNRLITIKEVESVIKNPPINKNLGPVGFTGESYQTFKELISILLKLFQKIEEEGVLMNSFYKTYTTLIPKPDKDNMKK